MGNPYWDRVTAVANKQREKGIAEYGRGIEVDTADIDVRLNRIEEELIDALMYIEHLRDGIKKPVNNFKQIDNEKDAIAYIKKVLTWDEWCLHHTKLVSALEILLSKLESDDGGSKI